MDEITIIKKLIRIKKWRLKIKWSQLNENCPKQGFKLNKWAKLRTKLQFDKTLTLAVERSKDRTCIIRQTRVVSLLWVKFLMATILDVNYRTSSNVVRYEIPLISYSTSNLAIKEVKSSLFWKKSRGKIQEVHHLKINDVFEQHLKKNVFWNSSLMENGS